MCPRTFEGCLFVAAEPAECRIKPCGNGTLFGEPATGQPMWAEPSVDALVQRMQQAYRSRRSAGELRARLVAHAAAQTWHDVGTQMLGRIGALLARKAQQLGRQP